LKIRTKMSAYFSNTDDRWSQNTLGRHWSDHKLG